MTISHVPHTWVCNIKALQKKPSDTRFATVSPNIWASVRRKYLGAKLCYTMLLGSNGPGFPNSRGQDVRGLSMGQPIGCPTTRLTIQVMKAYCVHGSASLIPTIRIRIVGLNVIVVRHWLVWTNPSR